MGKVGQTQTVGPGLKRVPQALAERRQWVAWLERKENGKRKKIQINPRTGRNASVTDPKTWGSFEEARRYFETYDVDGVGFVLIEDDPFVAIDLDNCRDPETGVLTPEAQELLWTLNSYAEVSPSGTGVHIWQEGSVLRNVRKAGVEIYKAGQFITVTGRHLKVLSPPEIAQREQELKELFQRIAGDRDANGNERSVPTPEGSLNEAQRKRIIREAEDGRNRAKFQKLWTGDYSGYDSQSEADLGLCRILALHCGCRKDWVDSLFRESALMRDKWEQVHGGDGRTYGEMTVAKAVASAAMS